MGKNYNRYIILTVLLLLVVAVILLVDFGTGKEKSTNMPTPTAPTNSKILVTHMIENPGQIPLRVTLQATTDEDIVELSIVIDDGITKQSIACTISPCKTERIFTSSGIVKYYAFAKARTGEIFSDPSNAPSEYKRFNVR